MALRQVCKRPEVIRRVAATRGGAILLIPLQRLDLDTRAAKAAFIQEVNMAKFRIRFKPDGSYVIRGQAYSGKQLKRQITLTAAARADVSEVMREVAEALKAPAPAPAIAQGSAGEPRGGQ